MVAVFAWNALVVNRGIEPWTRGFSRPPPMMLRSTQDNSTGRHLTPDNLPGTRRTCLIELEANHKTIALIPITFVLVSFSSFFKDH
jgi:hypothetical protein